MTALWCGVALSYITMWIGCKYTYPIPLESPSHPPHPTPVGHHRAASWTLSAIKQLSTSCLFYTWSKESKLWFSSSHAQMWEWDHKEGWVPKNWCFWTMVLEKTPESPLDCKEIQPVHPKGNQSWLFIGRTDAETPVLWPPDVKSRLTEKDLDAGKDWRWQEKRGTEDEMVGWHHWLNGHEFEQTPGDNGGKGSLGCCSHWGCIELDMT